MTVESLRLGRLLSYKMANAGTWVEENFEHEDSTLCWSSDQNILNYDGKHIFFHTVDRTLLFLEEALLSKRKIGVMVYPVTKTEIAIPMCVEALYSLMQSNDVKKKVLLVSHDLSVRELYWNLRANYMRINEVFPLGIVKMDGTIRPQLKTTDTTKISDVKCFFLHTSNPDFLPNQSISSEVGFLIVDTSGLSAISLEKLIRWAEANHVKAVLFLESNPSSENLELYNREHLPIWGWNSSSLQADFQNDLFELEKNPQKYSNPFSISVFLIKNWLSGIKREFIEVNSPELDPTLKEALQLSFDIRQISKESKSQLLDKALGSYISCRYAFEAMLAPVDDIETTCKMSFLAKPIEKRIESLESWQNLLSRHDPYYGSFWGKTHALCKVLFHKFKTSGNPKYTKLKELLRECIDAKQRVLILNYSEPYARALMNAVKRDFTMTEEELSTKGVVITSISAPQLIGDFDSCIVFGQIPFRASWILRLACAKRMIFLIYPTEKLFLKHQFEAEEKKTEGIFTNESRVNFLKAIMSTSDLKKLPPASRAGEEGTQLFRLSEAETAEEQKLKPLLEDFKIDDTILLEEEAESDESDDSQVSADGLLVVKCCKINLDDGSIMYFKPARRLPIFKDQKKLEYVDYHKVKVGDLLVLIKNNIRDNLAQEIIKKADNHPSMQRLKFLVNSWVIALRNGMLENKDTANSFLAKLQKAQQEEGCPEITNWLTIYFWKEGYIIGPQNPKNIKLIGKIYHEQFLIDNYAEIGQAISRLRGIHQRLLRKFNEMVMQAGLRTSRGQISDEIIDEEFNLHLEDFVDVISFAKVVGLQSDVYAEKSKLDKKLRES